MKNLIPLFLLIVFMIGFAIIHGPIADKELYEVLEADQKIPDTDYTKFDNYGHVSIPLD